MQKLLQYGVKLDSVKGKGYALLEPLVLLDQHKIKKHFPKAEVFVFEKIDSTNTYLKNLKPGLKQKTLAICLAEQQTKGRGRFDREWFSPFAKNIYLSCLYPFQKDVSELSGLSLVVSLAIARTLEDFGITKKCFVKWPNDIVYEQQKLSGSLIEVLAETHGACHAIIGIGVNVNMLQEEGRLISQAFTSMQQILSVYIDRNKVCLRLLENLFTYLQRFELQGLNAFMEEWKKADGLFGKVITVRNFNETLDGQAMGINEQGHLLLKTKAGNLRTLASGDTSLRARP